MHGLRTKINLLFISIAFLTILKATSNEFNIVNEEDARQLHDKDVISFEDLKREHNRMIQVEHMIKKKVYQKIFSRSVNDFKSNFKQTIFYEFLNKKMNEYNSFISENDLEFKFKEMNELFSEIDKIIPRYVRSKDRDLMDPFKEVTVCYTKNLNFDAARRIENLLSKIHSNCCYFDRKHFFFERNFTPETNIFSVEVFIEIIKKDLLKTLEEIKGDNNKTIYELYEGGLNFAISKFRDDFNEKTVDNVRKLNKFNAVVYEKTYSYGGSYRACVFIEYLSENINNIIKQLQTSQEDYSKLIDLVNQFPEYLENAIKEFIDKCCDKNRKLIVKAIDL